MWRYKVGSGAKEHDMVFHEQVHLCSAHCKTDSRCARSVPAQCIVVYIGITLCASSQDDSFYVGIGRERSDKMLMIESGSTFFDF